MYVCMRVFMIQYSLQFRTKRSRQSVLVGFAVVHRIARRRGMANLGAAEAAATAKRWTATAKKNQFEVFQEEAVDAAIAKTHQSLNQFEACLDGKAEACNVSVHVHVHVNVKVICNCKCKSNCKSGNIM